MLYWLPSNQANTVQVFKKERKQVLMLIQVHVPTFELSCRQEPYHRSTHISNHTKSNSKYSITEIMHSLTDTTNIMHLKTIVKPFRFRQFLSYVFSYDIIYKNVCTLSQKGQCGSILAMRAWHHILNFKNLCKHDQTICTKIAHHYPLSPGH